MKIHEKIRARRKEKNWTQEEMAEKLGMSILGYAKVERGKTDYQLGLENYLSKLIKIANVLELDLEKLIEDTEKNILIGLIDGDNHGFNSSIITSPTELVFEIQKLQLIIEHQKTMLEQKNTEIANQKEIIELLKNKSS